MRSTAGRTESAEEAALALVQRHAAELLRFARRFSHCADDAHDAYQRTVEVLVRRLRDDPPAQPLSWMRTVLRHEALALRAERDRLVGRAAVDLDRHEDRQADDPADRAVGHERLRQTAEALRLLKPQEVTALVLRAEGLSYREICDRTGWSYTRTNRAVTEGRRALIARLGAIESGAECARWQPALSAFADGEATGADVAALRPHLRSCPACRATLRAFHAAPARVAALVPPLLLPLAPAPADSALAHAALALHGLVERATLLAGRMQGAFETVPGAKLAAVAASTVVLAGGGAVLEQAAGERPASDAAAHAAAAADVVHRRLLTIASPLPAAAGAASDRKLRRMGASGGEFAREAASPSEFAPHVSPRVEFASAAAPTSPTAMAASPPAPPPSRAATTSTEFGGP